MNKDLEKTVIIEKIEEDAIIPTFGSEEAAGADLYSYEAVIIAPHSTVKIRTGLKMQIPKGSFYAIVARSGLSTKQGLRPANCFGVCDSDYRGEYIVALHNDSNYTRQISKDDRIAQIVLLPYIRPSYIEGKVDETERGEGGFGSSGK